jgi:hypothetical protein
MSEEQLKEIEERNHVRWYADSPANFDRNPDITALLAEVRRLQTEVAEWRQMRLTI